MPEALVPIRFNLRELHAFHEFRRVAPVSLDNCREQKPRQQAYLKFIFFSLPRASLRIALSYAFNNFSKLFCGFVELRFQFGV